MGRLELAKATGKKSFKGLYTAMEDTSHKKIWITTSKKTKDWTWKDTSQHMLKRSLLYPALMCKIRLKTTLDQNGEQQQDQFVRLLWHRYN